MEKFVVEFYEKSDGSYPAEEFIRNFFYVGQRIILTNGYIKKTQKTPVTEIELAKKYRRDFMNRMES